MDATSDPAATDPFAPMPFPPLEAPPAADLLAGGEARRRWLRYHVRDPIDGAGLWLGHYAVRAMPPALASAIGGAFARSMPRLVLKNAGTRQRLERNLERLMPGAGAAGLANWYENVGRSLAENSVAARLLSDGFVAWEGREHVAAAVASDRPLVFVSYHLGNWELVHTAVGGRVGIGAAYGLRVASPHVPSKNRIERRLAAKIRARHGWLALPATLETARRLHRILASGAGHAFLMIDERRERGIPSPRFGRPHPRTSNLIVAAKLARATDGLILPVYARRLGGARFALRFPPPIDPREAPDANTLADRLSDVSEAILRANADQWWTLRMIDLPRRP